MREGNISMDVGWIRAEGNFVSDMDGEKVMLSVRTGKYYNLGIVGGRIWELLERPITGAAIVQQLLTEFSVEHEACLQQVQVFLKQLYDEQLIEPAASELAISERNQTCIGVTER